MLTNSLWRSFLGSLTTRSTRRHRRRRTGMPLQTSSVIQQLEDRTLLSSVVTVGAEQQVNTYTTGNQQTSAYGSPSVAIAANGNYVATWSSDSQDGDSTGVYAQRFDANGNALGSEFRVNTYTTSSQIHPSIAMAASGEFVIVWNGAGQGGDTTGVHAQRYDADGNAVGGEFQVNTTSIDDQYYASVAMADSGEFVIAWSSNSQDGDQYGIFAQRYDAHGNALSGEFQVNTYTTGRQWIPSVAMAETGQFVISWTSDFQDGDDRGVYAQLYDANGNTVGGEFRVTTTTIGRQYNTTVSMANTGEFVVAWQSNNQDGDGGGIFAQRYAADGTPVGSEFQVNKTTQGSQSVPSVSMANSGEFVITWDSFGQDGNGSSVFGQRFDADGNALGDEFQVNSFTAFDQALSSIALNDAGQFVVAWTDLTQDGSGWGVYAQRFSLVERDATTVGFEQQINTFTPGSQQTNTWGTPSVAVAENGEYVITWASDSQDGSGQGVYAQRFDANGNPLGSEFQVNTYTSGNQNESTIAMAATGEFVIAWRGASSDGTLDNVYARRFDADGNALGGEFLVNTHTDRDQFNPSVSMADTGEFIIAWTSDRQDGSDRGIYAQRFDSNGIPVGSEFQVNTYTLFDQADSSIEMANTGEFIIAWTSSGQDVDGSTGVYAQRYDANGIPVGGEFQVNTYTADRQTSPSIGMSDSGAYVIVWQSVQDGDLDGIYGQRYGADGTVIGNEFLVNTTTFDHQGIPSVSMSGTGEFVVTWRSFGQDSVSMASTPSSTAPTAMPSDEGFPVNTFTTGNQWFTVSLNNAGQFVVAWTSDGQDGDSNGVYGTAVLAGYPATGAKSAVSQV
ncbi:MAG: hypothetical protein R3C02_24350 [Planctomycetaceae bacterium]